MTAEQIMNVVMFFLAVIGVIGGAWWRIEQRSQALEKKLGDHIKEVEGKADKAIADLAAHKLHAAETFATKVGMHEQTSQLLKAIESIGNRIDGRIDGLNDRLDRLYESPQRRTSTRS